MSHPRNPPCPKCGAEISSHCKLTQGQGAIYPSRERLKICPRLRLYRTRNILLR